MADVAYAVMDAGAAVPAGAEMAEMDAVAVAVDHPRKAALMEAIDAATVAAQAQVEAATAEPDGKGIKNAVAKVTGAAGGAGAQRSIADAVGMVIATEFAPRARGEGVSVRTTTLGTRVDTDRERGSLVEFDDHQDMIWAEIVGDANVMMKRLGANNAAVPVASIADT